MKRVKIMLMSALVVAVVGGALAFKAKVPQELYCTTGPNLSCTISDDVLFSITADGDQTAYCSTISHTGQGDFCPQVKVKATN